MEGMILPRSLGRSAETHSKRKNHLPGSPWLPMTKNISVKEKTSYKRENRKGQGKVRDNDGKKQVKKLLKFTD